jgi:phage shock protein C
VNSRRLYRSSDDRWIGGVAAGVADYFDVDPVLVRVLWLVSIPLTAGTSILAYLIMLIVVPQDPGAWPQPSPWQPGGAPVGYAANSTPPAAPADASAPNATGQAPDAGAAAPADSTTGAPGATPATAVPGQVPPTQGGDWRWQRRQERWQRRADRWQQKADRWEQRGDRYGSGGIVFGAILIVIGGLLAWHQVNPNLDLSLAWPIAIVLFGAFLILSSIGFRRGQ